MSVLLEATFFVVEGFLPKYLIITMMIHNVSFSAGHVLQVLYYNPDDA